MPLAYYAAFTFAVLTWCRKQHSVSHNMAVLVVLHSMRTYMQTLCQAMT